MARVGIPKGKELKVSEKVELQDVGWVHHGRRKEKKEDSDPHCTVSGLCPLVHCTSKGDMEELT